MLDEAGLGEVRGAAGIDNLIAIGRGAAANVYRGRQERFDREVAVKVLLSPLATDKSRRRFDRECRALGKLSQHPNIVTVYDSGVTGSDLAYLVMELCTGGSMAEVIETGPLPARDVTQIGVQLCSALHWAHAASTLHRDIKPGNILRTRLGEPVLADFGIAAIEIGEMSLSVHDSLTPVHSAPEVLLHGGGNVTSDVWSLASTLWTLLVGHPPFARADDNGLMSLMNRIVHDPLPAVERPDSGLLVGVLDAALTKDPAARIPSAGEFARRLQDVQRASGWSVTTFLGKSVPEITHLDVGEESAQRPSPLAGPPPVVLAGPPPQPVTAPPAPAVARPMPAAPMEQPAGSRFGRGRALLVSLVALVVIAVVVLAVFVKPGGSSHLPDPPQSQTLQLVPVTDADLTLQSSLMIEDDFKEKLGLPADDTTTIAGIYADSSEPGQLIALAAEPLDRPGGTGAALSALDKLPDLYPGALHGSATVAADLKRLGFYGSMTCTLTKGAGPVFIGKAAEACVWRDKISVGMVMLFDADSSLLDSDPTMPEALLVYRLAVEGIN